MKNIFGIAALVLLIAAAAMAQEAVAEPQIGDEITGMYSFVREGEFVQIEVDGGKVTGVVSRYVRATRTRPRRRPHSWTSFSIRLSWKAAG